MYFVGKRNNSLQKDSYLYHLIPSVFLLLILVIFSFVIYKVSYDASRNQIQETVKLATIENQRLLSERFSSYNILLKGAKGFVYTGDQIDENSWKNFVDSYNLDTSFAGTVGVGYSIALNKSEVEQHISNFRQLSKPDYNIFPQNSNDDFVTSILYLEPQNKDNNAAIGFDMYSEETRKEAMTRAAETGDIAISKPVKLVQDYEKNSLEPGVLMFMAVYKNKNNPKNLQNVKGFVYLPLRVRDTIGQTIVNNKNNIEYAVLSKDNQVLYSTDDFQNQKNQINNYEYQASINLPDQTTWQLVGLGGPSTLSLYGQYKPYINFFLSLAISSLIVAAVYLYLTNRFVQLKRKEQEGIQAAKEELVALASHQLRTPATGVKQYLGMLIEGYLGKLTKEQKKLAKKAYDSNERQLEIINEILVIARADAGQLKINKINFDMNRLILTAVSDHKKEAAKKNINIAVQLPVNRTNITADKGYIRMVLDNLINNAIKYSPDGAAVNIKLENIMDNCIVTVEDNGVGIAKKDWPDLFKKFSRIPNELSAKVAGTGIGLYLAKKLINLHGGKLLLEYSEPSKGSVFKIILPTSKIKKKKSKFL